MKTSKGRNENRLFDQSTNIHRFIQEQMCFGAKNFGTHSRGHNCPNKQNVNKFNLRFLIFFKKNVMCVLQTMFIYSMDECRKRS